ncbi:hypothetical protein Y1Q_0004130 [Alligator mississippiensis]|uniref:Endonuclease/exonuclease/phosphatase domain-containing protein n=1 Tax=Alligator mississippiensis TaxID=8496 RepID=A0A151PI43_ALLMI|nr:hypothetical protein Y1Q_0004130 [Alligator mississippiensis]
MKSFTLSLDLSQNHCATVISTYVLTLNSDEEVKERFYSDLNNALDHVILGDGGINFNARIGCDPEIWSRTISKNGMGKANANGILLLTKCAQHGLIMMNMVFHQKDQLKTTWRHPRSEHWHLLDYIVIQAGRVPGTVVWCTGASPYH